MNSEVVVVGSGASLLGKKRGKTIDSFNYVMRPIRCFVDDPEWSWYEDTGKKTTMTWVTYLNLFHLHYTPKTIDILFAFNDPDSFDELKNIYNPLKWPGNINRYYLDKLIDHSGKKFYITTNDLITSNYKLKIQYTQKNTLNKVRASTGIQAINFAINHFERVYITGFDHFMQGFYFNTTTDKAECPAHNYFLEACYLQSLIKNKLVYEL